MKKSSDTHELFEQIWLRVASAKAPASGGEVLSVCVSSRLPGEGATTVALGLAHAFSGALGGKALLIDVVVAKLELADRICIAATPYSPNNPVERSNEIAAHIAPFDGAGFDVLCLCCDALAAPEYEKYVRALLAALGGQYRAIVVDTGALDRHAPFVWSRCVRKSLLVVDSTRTTDKALERMRKEMDEGLINVSGVVLNKRTYPVPRFLHRSAG